MPPTPTLIDFFQPEWVQGALGFAFFCIVVVTGVFAYLNRYTERGYFRLWTMAWLFYAVFLAASARLVDQPHDLVLTTVRSAAVGISALFMFWGSFQLNGYDRPSRELVSGVVLMVIWSYVAVYRVHEALWFNAPVFSLLAVASVYTGLLYHSNQNRLRGSAILSSGFYLWGAFLLTFPVLTQWSDAAAVAYLMSGILALYIALGMVIQILNEERERHENLVGELNQGVARSRLLEHEISVTEQKYRELFDSASDAFFLVDLESLDIIEANQSAERLVSPLAERLVGRSFLDLCPDLRPESDSLLAHKKALDDVVRPFTTVRVVRADRSTVPCEGEARLIECNRRPVIQINMRETTERQRLERELRQAEKLSALGQLVAGVAHELNNPLAVISGYTQLLAKRPEVNQVIKQELHKILHEGDRAAKIVRNLLTFARPHEPEMRVVHLNELVQSVLDNHATELLAHGVQLEVDLAADLPPTKADPNQVEQVLA
ncbi:PAS domain S-box protein, partial [bacterium]|nr:PAS domain S-box protein [bacterium]